MSEPAVAEGAAHLQAFVVAGMSECAQMKALELFLLCIDLEKVGWPV
ncbi:hypothetical protein G6O69_01445 [Pseudenhygromyxa sp. WMMC2535]|nr:hypothetical protein [Pseudenhygromyxa sp. WMMC2535]NVB36477.1 hypothetical protein [Pseudenhygromyxa sp. WMMC2535]